MVSNQLLTSSNGNTLPFNHSWSYRTFALNPCSHMSLSLITRSYIALFFKNFKVLDLLCHCDIRIHVFGFRCRKSEVRTKFPATTFVCLMLYFSLLMALFAIFLYQYYGVYNNCLLVNITNLRHIVCGTALRCLGSFCSLTCCVGYRGHFKGVISIPLFKLSSQDDYRWHYNFINSHFVVQLFAVSFAFFVTLLAS